MKTAMFDPKVLKSKTTMEVLRRIDKVVNNRVSKIASSPDEDYKGTEFAIPQGLMLGKGVKLAGEPRVVARADLDVTPDGPKKSNGAPGKKIIAEVEIKGIVFYPLVRGKEKLWLPVMRRYQFDVDEYRVVQRLNWGAAAVGFKGCDIEVGRDAFEDGKADYYKKRFENLLP